MAESIHFLTSGGALGPLWKRQLVELLLHLLPDLLVVLVNTLLQFCFRDGAVTQQPANKALHCAGPGKACNWLAPCPEDEGVVICVPVRVQAQCSMLSVCVSVPHPGYVITACQSQVCS